MDFRIYDALNDFVSAHPWLGRLFEAIESASIPVFVVATLALWLVARPGAAARKWKLATASGLLAAAIAVGADRLIAAFWDRPRPFTVDRDGHVFGAHSNDASFPSDHSAASFAIAFAVFAYDRLVGSIFLVAATLVGVGRVLVGVHYPGDVIAGALVGAGAAILAARVARPLLVRLVRVVERATDPLVAPAWRRVARGRR